VRSPNIFLATCLMQFAKAGSVATLSQQEKNNSADVQRGGFNPRGDAPSTSPSNWPIASRQARHRRRTLNCSYAAFAGGTNLDAGLRRPCRGQTKPLFRP
jgi:hypothetical protein